MKSDLLFLKIQPDGERAGLYSGGVLVVGFKWCDFLKSFYVIGSTREWDELILHNKTFHYYLDHVLELLEVYRGEVLKLAAQREATEKAMSGFLSIGE